MYVCLFARVRACVRASVRAYVCMFVCMYVCMYQNNSPYLTEVLWEAFVKNKDYQY